MKPTIKMLESPLTHTTTFRGDLVTHHMLIYLTFPSWKLNNIAIAIVSSNQHRQLNFGDPITPNLWVDLLLERVLKWNIEKLAIKCIHRREKRSQARRPKRRTQRPWQGSKRHRPQCSTTTSFWRRYRYVGPTFSEWGMGRTGLTTSASTSGRGTSTPCLTTEMLMWPTTSLSLSLSLSKHLFVYLYFSLYL